MLAVPTGVLIAPGIQFSVGDRALQKLPYSLCAPDHCEAILNMDQDTPKALSTHDSAQFLVTGSNGAVAKFTVNLKGFEEALATVGK